MRLFALVLSLSLATVATASAQTAAPDADATSAEIVPWASRGIGVLL